MSGTPRLFAQYFVQKESVPAPEALEKKLKGMRDDSSAPVFSGATCAPTPPVSTSGPDYYGILCRVTPANGATADPASIVRHFGMNDYGSVSSSNMSSYAVMTETLEAKYQADVPARIHNVDWASLPQTDRGKPNIARSGMPILCLASEEWESPLASYGVHCYKEAADPTYSTLTLFPDHPDLPLNPNPPGGFFARWKRAIREPMPEIPLESCAEAKTSSRKSLSCLIRAPHMPASLNPSELKRAFGVASDAAHYSDTRTASTAPDLLKNHLPAMRSVTENRLMGPPKPASAEWTGFRGALCLTIQQPRSSLDQPLTFSLNCFYPFEMVPKHATSPNSSR